jgi:hypothetical protein
VFDVENFFCWYNEAVVLNHQGIELKDIKSVPPLLIFLKLGAKGKLTPHLMTSVMISFSSSSTSLIFNIPSSSGYAWWYSS